MKNLILLENRLKELALKQTQNHGIAGEDYYIPDLWLDPYSVTFDRKKVEPIQYFLNKISEIKIYNNNKLSISDNISISTLNLISAGNIYNMLIRYSLAFDHNNDGEINNSDNCFKETGTFLKALSILPYIKSLGVDKIYLLPITTIGKSGKKGSAGSCYSISDPYKLDENLSETVLGLNVNIQYAAFVEACHMMDMKVINEFVFRTASIDTDLAVEHPDWFYWIKYDTLYRDKNSVDQKQYGPPIFSTEELKEIKEKGENLRFSDLIEPGDDYKSLFTETPKTVIKNNGEIFGYLADGSKCKIPCAFADWPPDDKQPVWSDVTYLKMYNHPDFNYIAYNTIRMYDENLEKEEYEVRDLWDRIINIIPYYKDEFSIDGVMIDMGHALPKKLRRLIVETARKNDPDFIIWEENFFITEKSKFEGYDAVVGLLPFDAHYCNKMKEFLIKISNNDTPIKYFAMSESHNTPRTAERFSNIEFSKLVWSYFPFLKNGLPLILSGFELGETMPINTGLGFENYDLTKYPPSILPLFSNASMNWTNDQNIIETIRNVYKLRNEVLFLDKDYQIILPEYYNDFALCFIIRSKIINFDFLVIVNYLFEYKNNINVILPEYYLSVVDLHDNSIQTDGNALQVTLKPKETLYVKLNR